MLSYFKSLATMMILQYNDCLVDITSSFELTCYFGHFFTDFDQSLDLLIMPIKHSSFLGLSIRQAILDTYRISTNKIDF